MSLSPIHIDPDRFLKEHFSLPPLPELVTTIVDMVNSGTAGASDVADLVSTDPALTAQILKVVNSAYYGLPRRIADVKHAVAYLGLAEVQRIVLALSVMKALAPESREDFDRFWFHSFYTALTAKQVARAFERSLDTGDLYAAALLHDIGKLVYLKFFPDHFRELDRWARQNRRLMLDAERHYELPSHTTLGALLCEHWRLPDPVKDACVKHEPDYLRQADDPSALPPFHKVLCVSNLLVNLGTAPLDDELKDSIHRLTQQATGCSESEFLVLMGEVYELEGEVKRFLEQLQA